jgi:hypothetical protein
LETSESFSSVYRQLHVLVLVGVLGATPVAAQESSLADTADRPGYADSPILLGPGHVQMEFGFTSEHETTDQQSIRTHTWPQVEVHAGVSSRVDVSVFWDGVISKRATPGSEEDQDATGGADVRVGGKLRLLHRPRFAAALIGYLTAPVGSIAFSSRYTDPFARLAWAATISDRFGISGTVDLKAVRVDDDSVETKPAASALLAGAIYRAVDGFIGIAVEPPDIGSRPSLMLVETGLVLPIGARNQFDIWISKRVRGDPEDWFISVGYIRRLR